MGRVIAAAAAAVMVLGLAACSTDDQPSEQYARVCVDQATNERVTGDQCGTDDSNAASGFLWYYLLYGRALPAYGYPVSGGVTHVSQYAVVQHAERLAPKGGKSYEKAPARAYSTGNGKPLPASKGGTGYKGPAVRPPAPKAPAPAVKAPAGGGYKPAPAAPRPVAPPARPIAPPVRVK